VGKPDKILFQVLSGGADQNVRFSDLCALLAWLGFDLRVKGSHHVFTRTGVAEILNLQDKQGKAKPYQVKQVREVITRYRLAGDADE
jgi:hypothetical protein